jgi:hypothetical protein
METNSNMRNEVLHSANHSTLSAEEIAKAVARHNHKHPGKTQTVTSAPAAKRSGKR